MWEKAGINVSVVYGSMPAEAYRAATSQNGSSVGPTSLISRDRVCGVGGWWEDGARGLTCVPPTIRTVGRADRSPAGLLARCAVTFCAAKLSSRCVMYMRTCIGQLLCVLCLCMPGRPAAYA